MGLDKGVVLVNSEQLHGTPFPFLYYDLSHGRLRTALRMRKRSMIWAPWRAANTEMALLVIFGPMLVLVHGRSGRRHRARPARRRGGRWLRKHRPAWL